VQWMLTGAKPAPAAEAADAPQAAASTPPPVK
jgi:hypothetical protein